MKQPHTTLSRSRIPICSLALAALIGLVPATRAQSVRQLVTQTVDDRRTIELMGNTRPEANASSDLGPVDDSLILSHMQLLLQRPPETEAALVQLIDQMHDRSSPNFHQWLDSQRLRDEFGPSQNDIDAVATWLSSHGLTVHGVRLSGMMIDFSGTAGQVRDTFHTEIHSLDVRGEAHIANMSNPRIPAALAGVVSGVTSLSDFRGHKDLMPKTIPDYTFVVNGQLELDVVPADLWKIYNFTPQFSAGITGKGQTIVVVEDTNLYDTADWTTFRKKAGLSGYTSASLTQVHPAPPSGTNNCSNPGITSDEDEAALDVEWASAAAPNAAIELASCANTNTLPGIINATINLVDAKTTPAILSMSYDDCEAVVGATFNASLNAIYQKGVALGMSIFVSTGDQLAGLCNGDTTVVTDGIGVNAFASTPYTVAAGGTDFGDVYLHDSASYWSSTDSAIGESALSYIPEIPWNNSCGSELLAAYLLGSGSTSYGPKGLCTVFDATSLVNNNGGSGGPSGCASGAPSKAGVVGGTCKGWPKPSWQKLVGNPADGVRDLPDVSLFAASGAWNHAYIYCNSDTANHGAACSGEPQPPSAWSSAGGTSFVAPILAGI
jgi:subtilase family serine protease